MTITRLHLDVNNMITAMIAICTAITWVYFTEYNHTLVSMVSVSATLNVLLHRIYENKLHANLAE